MTGQAAPTITGTAAPRDFETLRTALVARSDTLSRHLSQVAAAMRQDDTVLTITDNALGPVAGLAAHVLYVNEARPGDFRSQVPAMVVTQVMLGLARRLGPVENNLNARNGNFVASNRGLTKDHRGRML